MSSTPPFDTARCPLIGGPLDGARYRLADLLDRTDDNGIAWLRHQGCPEAYIEQDDAAWIHASLTRDQH